MYKSKTKQIEVRAAQYEERGVLSSLRSPLMRKTDQKHIERQRVQTGRVSVSSTDDKNHMHKELTDAILARRQKDLDYGRNTDGYRNYITLVPRNERKQGQPQTPDKFQTCGHRTWDFQVRKWRRMLHGWDPVNSDAHGMEPLSKRCPTSSSFVSPAMDNSRFISNKEISQPCSPDHSLPDVTAEVLDGYKTWEEMFLEECENLEEKENVGTSCAKK